MTGYLHRVVSIENLELLDDFCDPHNLFFKVLKFLSIALRNFLIIPSKRAFENHDLGLLLFQYITDGIDNGLLIYFIIQKWSVEEDSVEDLMIFSSS